MIENKYYVYGITFKGFTVYLGKGCGNRIDSEKNEWFNLFDKELRFEREIVATGMSSKAAETLEASLIREYNPVFNKNNGLSPQKWVKLTDREIQTRVRDHHAGDLPTPKNVADLIHDYAKGLPNVSSVLYPCAGCGSLNFPDLGAERYAVEINPENAAELARIPGIFNLTADFLTWDTTLRFDLIVMNPPFTTKGNNYYWKKFVEKAQSLLTKDGVIISVIPENTFVFTNEVLSGVTFDGVKGATGRVVIIDKATEIKQVQKRLVTAKDLLRDFGLTVCRKPNAKDFMVRYADTEQLYGIRFSTACAATSATLAAEKSDGRNAFISANYDLEPLLNKIKETAEWRVAFGLAEIYSAMQELTS